MIFNNKFIELILTELCFILLLNEKLQWDVSALSVSDICEYVEKQAIYCDCDNQGVDEARVVTCFIIENDGLTRSSPIWNGFKLQKNITSLMLTTRFNKKLTFLPVSALKNVADSLETLEINEMKLGHLETNSIKNFPKLSKIRLESNDIRGLGVSCFAHLSALKSLSLSSNSIETLKSGAFVDLPKLAELFLDRNRLQTIEDNAFSELKIVSELDLRLNQINVITSATFGGLISLTRLDLSLNQLKTIPSNGFMGAPRLRELDLSKNQIETIDENAFQNMSHLMSIQLNENKIRFLSTQVLKGCPKLVLVDLSTNLLETFENQLIIDLNHLKDDQFVFYLRDNRLQCDCRLFWLRNMTNQTFGLLFRRELKHYKCELNEDLANLKSGDKIKILELVKMDEFVGQCLIKTSTEDGFEETLLLENVSTDNKVVYEEKANQINMTPNQSTTGLVENSIDSDNKQLIEKEIHSSTETVVTEFVAKETEKLTNDINEGKKTTELVGVIKASHERTGAKDGVNSYIESNKNIVCSVFFILYVFQRNQLIL